MTIAPTAFLTVFGLVNLALCVFAKRLAPVFNRCLHRRQNGHSKVADKFGFGDFMRSRGQKQVSDSDVSLTLRLIGGINACGSVAFLIVRSISST